jgi:hypothetical protein
MADLVLPAYLRLDAALLRFVSVIETQGQKHIKPLHQHIATRLVIEGGFFPDEITPHPPLRVEKKGDRLRLVFDQGAQSENEQTVLGGLKTKDIDVVVNKPNVGPVVAISVKGTGKAFRNLTNRMEEAIGDSTNLHVMYPGLVYAFMHILKAHRPGAANLEPNDIALNADGEPVQSIRRYHDVLLGLAGRRMVRDDLTRYEAVSLALVDCDETTAGTILERFPAAESPLNLRHFFETVYKTYDLRFPYVAPSVPGLRRREWSADSPLFDTLGGEDVASEKLGYLPRLL